MGYDGTPPCSPHGDKGLDFGKFYSRVTSLKPSFLKKITVNMRMSIDKNVMPCMKTPLYLTKEWIKSFGHILRHPFFMYQEKGVLIWRPLEILVWKRIV